MKHLILTISLIFAATALKANEKPFARGDVFYCSVEVGLAWQSISKSLTQSSAKKFKFTIDDNKVIQFGDDYPFYGLRIGTDFMGVNLITASDNIANLTLNGKVFNYAEVGSEHINMLAATCDRF